MGQGDSDRYELLRPLGEGISGTVYEAYDREQDRTVALKTLTYMDAGTLYRFKREFRALSGVRHSSIVELYELASKGDTWFFTMEIIDGPTWLEDVIRSDAKAAGGPDERPRLGDRVDVERLRNRLAQLAGAIHWLHSYEVIHRDLKPSNVLVSKEGRVVVVDFGIATDPEAQARAITEQRDQLMGTPEYMAPEQSRAKRLTPAVDWYAMGTMLYEALTGTVPYSGPPLRIIFDRSQRDPTPPGDLVEDIPEDLATLCMDLLAREPSARPTGEEVLERLGEPIADSRARRGHDDAFVGRQDELETLRRLLAESRQGAARQVIVEGPSGVGKSALVGEFLREAEDEGALVLRGRCFGRELVPFNAFDAAIDQLSRALLSEQWRVNTGSLSSRVSYLTRIFPVLGRVPSLANAPLPTSTLTDAEMRSRAFRALRRILRRLVRKGPVILHLEDFQWADRDSARLLSQLTQSDDAPKLLLIVTHRTEATASRRASDQLDWRLPTATKIALESLDDGDARELAAQLMGVRSDHPMVSQAATESGGSPYYLRELAHFARHMDTSTSLAQLRLDSLIDARIHRLSAAACELLELIVLAARPIEEATLRSAASVDGRAVADAIRDLQEEMLIRRVRVSERVALEPYHDRVSSLVADSISRERSVPLHGALADALVAAGAAENDPERLLAHLEAAGQAPRAARLAREAATRARELLAFDHCVTLLRKAVVLWPRGDREVRAKVQWEFAEAFERAGHGAAAAERYLRLAKRAPAERALEARRRAAEQLMSAGRVEPGLEAVRDVLESIGESYPTAGQATTGVVWETVRRFFGGFRYRKRDPKDVPENQRLRADVYWSVAQSLSHVDLIASRLYNLKALRLVLSMGDEGRISRQLSIESNFRAANGHNRAAAEALLDRARAIGEAAGDPVALSYCSHSSWLICFWSGEFVDALSAWERADRETLGIETTLRNVHREFHLFTLRMLGRYRAIAEHRDSYREDAVQRGDYFAQSALTSASAMAWLAADQPEAALEELAANAWVGTAAGGRPQDVPNYWHLYAQAQVTLYRGDADRARKLIPALRPFVHSPMRFVQLVVAELAWILARLSLLVGEFDEARKLSKRIRGVPPLEPWRLGVEVGIALAEERDASGLLGELQTHTEGPQRGLAQVARHLAGDAAGTDALEREGVVDPDRFSGIFFPTPRTAS